MVIVKDWITETFFFQTMQKDNAVTNNLYLIQAQSLKDRQLLGLHLEITTIYELWNPN